MVSLTLIKKYGAMVKASLANGMMVVGLPGVSLVPCIPHESREDRKQVSYTGITLETNRFATHAADEGWEEYH